jgi:Mn-dependent DtxR family transcriptional regulator
VPTALEVQILQVLRTLTTADRPATFNDLARRLGATAPLIASIARGLVAEGLAEPSYVQVHGVRTLTGLMPQPATAAQP